MAHKKEDKGWFDFIFGRGPLKRAAGEKPVPTPEPARDYSMPNYVQEQIARDQKAKANTEFVGPKTPAHLKPALKELATPSKPKKK